MRRPLMLFILLLGGLLLTSKLVEASDPPYPPSPVIANVIWARDTLVAAAPGSDLWPTTWAADDGIYTSWGDGGGFGGTNVEGRVSMGFARLEGPPSGFVATNINGGVNSEWPPTWACPNCGKTAGILSVSGVLYAWINMQNGPVPDKRLAWSHDQARTWTFSDWKFPAPDDSTFLPSTFLNFGQDYAGARDDYVYSYGAKWTLAQGQENNVYLMRVAKNSIQNRDAYEFYVGTDESGTPRWTKDSTQRKPVFSDRDGVNNTGLASVVYNAGIGRYLLTVAHRASNNRTEAGLGRLGVFDAPEPWGPWTTVAYYDNWLDMGDSPALIYGIPTKWISNGGTIFWMTFSAPSHDQFNMIQGRLILRNPVLDSHAHSPGDRQP